MINYNYFSRCEWCLWLISLLTIVTNHFLFGESNLLTLTASLIGATSLIFSAKGNPIGQGLMIIFSVIYAYLSLINHYYGEVITYFFLNLPLAIISLLTWLNHPFRSRKSQVLISRLSIKDIYSVSFLTFLVTICFYFILGTLHTSFLLMSTLSITTSFLATLLTYKRSPYFALVFSLNDLVLMSLWMFEADKDPSHYSIVICFLIFLVNDVYTFVNWIKLQKQQENLLQNEL